MWAAEMVKCTFALLFNLLHYSIQMEKVSSSSTVEPWKNNTYF